MPNSNQLFHQRFLISRKSPALKSNRHGYALLTTQFIYFCSNLVLNFTQVALRRRTSTADITKSFSLPCRNQRLIKFHGNLHIFHRNTPLITNHIPIELITPRIAVILSYITLCKLNNVSFLALHVSVFITNSQLIVIPGIFKRRTIFISYRLQ